MTTPESSPPTVLTEDERAALLKWADDRDAEMTAPNRTDEQLDAANFMLTSCVERILANREAKLADRVAAAVQAERAELTSWLWTQRGRIREWDDALEGEHWQANYGDGEFWRDDDPRWDYFHEQADVVLGLLAGEREATADTPDQTSP